MFDLVKFRYGGNESKSYDVGGVLSETKEEAIKKARRTMAHHLAINSLSNENEEDIYGKLQAYFVS
jgi:hypothetical protein